MSYSAGRMSEEFKEELRKSSQNKNDMLLMSPQWLARNIDSDVVSKCRLHQYGKIEKMWEHTMNKTGDYEDVEKYREKNNKFNCEIDVLDYPTQTNFAKLYFETYGENSEGGEIPDNDSYYDCPCGVHYAEYWGNLPNTCKRCGRITPMGRLNKDKVARR